jgi:hypothetical protein
MSDEETRADIRNILAKLTEIHSWIQSVEHENKIEFDMHDTRIRALEIIASQFNDARNELRTEVKKHADEIGKLKESRARIAGGLALLIFAIETLLHLSK